MDHFYIAYNTRMSLEELHNKKWTCILSPFNLLLCNLPVSSFCFSSQNQDSCLRWAENLTITCSHAFTRRDPEIKWVALIVLGGAVDMGSGSLVPRSGCWWGADQRCYRQACVWRNRSLHRNKSLLCHDTVSHVLSNRHVSGHCSHTADFQDTRREDGIDIRNMIL